MMKFSALGDQAVVVTFGEKIDLAIYENVQNLCSLLKQNPFHGMIECVPSFASLTVYYDVYKLWEKNERKIVPYDFVCEYVNRLLSHTQIKRKNNMIVFQSQFATAVNMDLI